MRKGVLKIDYCIQYTVNIQLDLVRNPVIAQIIVKDCQVFGEIHGEDLPHLL